MKNVAQLRQCPECQAEIPVHVGYVTWCDHCGWNVQPIEPEPPDDIFKSAYASISRRLGQSQFQKMVRAKSLKPSWTLSKLLALLMAVSIHGLTLVFAIVGGWVLIAAWPNPFVMFFGFLFLLIAWFLRPRFPKMPDGIVPRNELPTLYKIVDNVAQVLDTSSIYGLVIDEQFNASFSQVNWQRRRMLHIGLPLFSILGGQEKVALVAHELAHNVNGDPARSLLIGTAVSVDVTHPSTAFRVQLLRNRAVSEPRVVLSSPNVKRIDQELQLLQEKIQRKLVDQYLVSISR